VDVTLVTRESQPILFNIYKPGLLLLLSQSVRPSKHEQEPDNDRLYGSEVTIYRIGNGIY
jgi:hypothetical protein